MTAAGNKTAGKRWWKCRRSSCIVRCRAFKEKRPAYGVAPAKRASIHHIWRGGIAPGAGCTGLGGLTGRFAVCAAFKARAGGYV
ncbi:MAG: hypothetical protein DU429_02090 [Candidatus Tokpelaia sp.]|nr:MAG: hypothetical protein DU430_03810 [Candidatus Tokpelaia sp.]KAA6207292.1 MAG: hypothetical protein DU429_02090 [Candidatus Tokpelaia sp.]